MQTVGSTYSVVLNEAGRRRPVRPFRVLCKRMAAAEVHRWEGYLESRVQAKGWDGQLLRGALQECAASAQMVSVEGAPQRSCRNCKAGRCASCDEPLNCCLCFRGPDCLVHLMAFVVLRAYLLFLMDGEASCCKNDGKVVWWLVLLLSTQPFGMSGQCADRGFIFNPSWKYGTW